MADYGKAAFDLATKIATEGKKRITVPDGMGYNPPFNVYRDVVNSFYTDFDITKYQPTGKTYYVSPTGSDSNDGLTLATAFASVNKAVSMPDVDVVLIRYGLYDRAKGTLSTSPTRNISIKAFGGPVTLSAHDNLTWTLTAGQTNTYQAARSGVGMVYDAKSPDANGDYVRYTQQTSIANVEANAGSWYSDGTNVYVHCSGNRVPDTNIRAFLATNSNVISGKVTVYLEGITFEGGNQALLIQNTSSTAIPTVYAKDCGFKYASLYNALSVLGGNTYLVNCLAAQAFRDGFNYHFQNGVLCTSVEINCTGRNNGYDTTSSNNNGSTTHDGNTIVRVNGMYNNNNGPNVCDVNGSKSWLVSCEAHHAVPNGSGNIWIEGNMWCDSCNAHDSTYDLVTNISGSTMYIRNYRSKDFSRFSIASGTSIVPY